MQSNAANALESARRSSGSAAPGDPVRHRHGIRHQRPEVENAADDPVEKESHCGMATKIRTRKCLNFLLTRFSSRYPRRFQIYLCKGGRVFLTREESLI